MAKLEKLNLEEVKTSSPAGTLVELAVSTDRPASYVHKTFRSAIFISMRFNALCIGKRVSGGTQVRGVCNFLNNLLYTNVCNLEFVNFLIATFGCGFPGEGINENCK